MQTFTAPIDGVYKLEVWGAQGNYGGKGGYSIGYKTLNTSNNLYVCIGQCPWSSPSLDYSYNGGGGGDMRGGGASHIAISNRGELYNYFGYENEVLLVAGGGGGSERFAGGVGGGITGGDGSLFNTDNTGYSIAVQSKGGSQLTGGSAGRPNGRDSGGQSGTFGRGGHGYIDPGEDQGAGGGGGWYGGGGINFVGSAGGGSGHINATLITNGVTIAGDQTFPSPSGGTETGHERDGFCIITWQQLL